MMPVLAEKEYCTGCAACASVCREKCISMEADGEGFLFPKVDGEKCIGCGKCEKTCPLLNKKEEAKRCLSVYAAYSKNGEMRKESSSGGIFTEIAKDVIAKGGAVFGAAYDGAFGVLHICAESEEKLAVLRGAKYAQSDIGKTFSEAEKMLRSGREVLFSGTPCQIAGLKAFLGREYENLLAVDFVCHSVPSPSAWKGYVKFRAEKDNGGELPEKINLRSKISGWSRYSYSNLFEYGNGKTNTAKSGESIYMKLFVGGYISRKSCGNCRFKGFERASDITVGDFWGIWNSAPEMDDGNGTSLVMIHTEKGKKAFEDICGRTLRKKMSEKEAKDENPAIINSAAQKAERETALEKAAEGRYDELWEMFFKDEAKAPSLMKRAAAKLKRILGK